MKLVKSTMSLDWAAEQPEFSLSDLLSLYAINDSFARRVVSHAKRRLEIYTAKAYKQPPKTIDVSTQEHMMTYIMSTSNVNDLKGRCYIAAHVFSTLLAEKGAKAKTVRVQADKSDHYFTVVNLGTKDNSLIVDATWQQFGGTGQYCLAGTLKKVKESISDKKVRALMESFYATGLEVLKDWGGYQCFATPSLPV